MAPAKRGAKKTLNKPKRRKSEMIGALQKQLGQLLDKRAAQCPCKHKLTWNPDDQFQMDWAADGDLEVRKKKPMEVDAKKSKLQLEQNTLRKVNRNASKFQQGGFQKVQEFLIAALELGLNTEFFKLEDEKRLSFRVSPTLLHHQEVTPMKKSSGNDGSRTSMVGKKRRRDSNEQFDEDDCGTSAAKAPVEACKSKKKRSRSKKRSCGRKSRSRSRGGSCKKRCKSANPAVMSQQPNPDSFNAKAAYEACDADVGVQATESDDELEERASKKSVKSGAKETSRVEKSDDGNDEDDEEPSRQDDDEDDDEEDDHRGSK